MTICKFYQQGNCKFGNNCRFEHPNGNRNQSSNRFGAFGDRGGSGGSNSQSILEKYRISTDVIETDLAAEAPQWILSAYAPGRDAPEQMFGGYPREQSFEEMRLHYLTGKASGNEQAALNQAQELYQNAQQQMQTAVRNVREAANFVVEAENKHPNRHDICREGTQGHPFGEFLVGKRPKSSIPEEPVQANPFSANNSSQPSAFGGGAPTTSAFGQPSALGQRPNPFGQPSQPSPAQSTPAFGQPSQPASAFGQPSQPTSAFGQQSKPGGFGAPSFGQPSQPAPAFGQTSQPAAAAPAFGQTSQPSSAFGQPSQLGAKPSAFGAPSFGQPSQPSQGSAFGQPSQLGAKPNPFASTSDTNTNASPFASAGANTNNNAPSPFGQQSSNQGSAPNPFGAASNNQSQPSSNAFGQPSQPSGAFGQPAAQAANPFAAASQAPAQDGNNPFGQKPAQQSGGFPSGQPQQTNGVFGQPSNSGSGFSQANASNPFGQPAAPNAAQQTAGNAGSANPYPPDSTRQHPPIESYSAKGMNGLLTMFQNKPVIYDDGKPFIKQFDGTKQRIWFPDGPPAFNRDTALPPEQYDEKTKSQWASFAETGQFADGLMPELPPPRDCTLWNF